MLLQNKKQKNVFKRTDDPGLLARLLREGYVEVDEVPAQADEPMHEQEPEAPAQADEAKPATGKATKKA